MFCIKHRSIKVTLFSEIHFKIFSKFSLTYHQIASLFLSYTFGISSLTFLIQNILIHVPLPFNQPPV